MSHMPSRRRLTHRVKDVVAKRTNEEARAKAAEVAKQGGRLVLGGPTHPRKRQLTPSCVPSLVNRVLGR